MTDKLEYKIITGSASECQKWLNQWKHEYKLKILEMAVQNQVVVILLTRQRINLEQNETIF